MAGDGAVLLLGGGGNTLLLVVDCGGLWSEGCGDVAELLESVGEEVRCTGFRPTGGADFLDVVLVDETEGRRSLVGVMACTAGWLAVDMRGS